MKRILVVENGAGFGGALTSIASFFEKAPVQDFEFHLLTSYNQDYIGSDSNVTKVISVPRNRLYGQSSLLENMLRPIFWNLTGNLAYLIDHLSTGRKYSKFIKNYIIDNGIDILHTNNSILINDAAILGGYYAQVPIVAHIRAPEYKSRVASLLAKRADHFLSVSSFTSNSLSALNIPESKISIVPEGLDVKIFSDGADGVEFKKSINLPLSKPVIGIVGCLVAWKGHRFFLEAFAKIIQTVDAVALIVGDVPEESSTLRQELEDFACQLGVSDKIWFTGHRNDIADAVDACDIVVHASTSPEPFGRVILEALALRKPVIATNQGGPVEIIDNGIEGLLVPPNDVTEMADKIGTLLKDDVLRVSLGSRGRKKVVECYSVEQHCLRIIEAYRMVG